MTEARTGWLQRDSNWPLHTRQCRRGSVCDPPTESQRRSPAHRLYPLSSGVCGDAPSGKTSFLICIHTFLVKVCAADGVKKSLKLWVFVCLRVSARVFSVSESRQTHVRGVKTYSQGNEFGRLGQCLFFTRVTRFYCISAFYLLVRKNLFTFGIPVSSER